jgi:hypothetical protein
MVQLNKRVYAEFDNMVQLKRYYGSTKTPNSSDDEEIDNILPNLKQVKRFLVNGQAFSQFQSRFEEILQSRGQDEVATTNAEAEVS